jgi:beta-phosphoglucomutase-like phosphatase (HAD superfamily)
VIEDSSPGLQAAREAGMRSIHYAPEGGSSHELVATTFSQLPALIESIR